MRKCTIYDIPTYTAFSRVKDLKTGVSGYRYILDKPLSEIDQERLNKFNNVCLGTATLKYAPEQKFDIVIIYDKNIYFAVDEYNNSYIMTNLYWKKFLRDHGCKSVIYFGYFNKKRVLL